MKSVEERMSAARTALVLDHPFFGALALRMKVVEAPSKTKTMATDGSGVFYNRAYVKSISDEELIGLWAHEVMHPAMQHHTRRGDRDPKLWNEAADYAINPILMDAGLTLPAGGLVDPRFKGKAAEEIYGTLAAEKLPQEQGGDDGEGQGGDGDSEGEGSGQGDDDGEGDGDSGAGEVPGGVLDAPDPAQAEADWQVAVKQAAQAAQMMGKLPAGVALAVEEALKPRLDWRALLRRFVQQNARSDYSWKMPNRRYIAQGSYLPEIRSEEMPPMAAYVDTSGSTLPFRAAFVGELDAIASEVLPESMIVVHCDAAVAHVETFERGEPLDIKEWKGNGGTDFRPAFDYAEREQLQPACAIYLTDGYGLFPDEPPPYPVLWVMTTDQVAPWGETIKITD